MKTLELSNTELAEETLVNYKGKNFLIKTVQGGQYGFERKVTIFIIQDDCSRVLMKTVGILRLFDDNYEQISKSEQCLVIGRTHFNPCLDSAKDYIQKFLDFITQ